MEEYILYKGGKILSTGVGTFGLTKDGSTLEEQADAIGASIKRKQSVDDIEKYIVVNDEIIIDQTWEERKRLESDKTAKEKEKAIIKEIYVNNISSDILFTSSAGDTRNYQADFESRLQLHQIATVFSINGAVPEGFYYVASDNTKVPFSLKDLQNLGDAMVKRGWQEFQQMQDKKTTLAQTKSIG